MRCVECEETITNPICPACLQVGVEQWLREEHREALVPELHELTRRVFWNDGETFCIKCNNLMSTCAYCYTKAVFDLIRHEPDLLQRYLVYFNYDLGHMGWEQEAVALIDT